MKTSKKVDTNPRLSVRDPDRSLRQTFGVIGKRIAVGGDMAAGVRYAASFTEGATRHERAPKDWNEIGLSTLRTLAVYGYDHFTRAEALRRIEKWQYDSLRLACHEVDDDVTRLSWLQSLINEAQRHSSALSDGDENAIQACLIEVQTLHDCLQIMLKDDTHE